MAVGYLKTNPCQGVKLPRIKKSDIKPLMDDEVNQFLNAIEGNEYETLFTVTMYTGLRQSDAYVNHGQKNAPYFSPERVLKRAVCARSAFAVPGTYSMT